MDKQETTQLLLDCGASIHEINTIRKHLSGIKEGRLARAAYPAVLACLVLSDVVGDNLNIIASGPAVADPGTFGQCLDIIRTRGLGPKLPPAVLRHLEHGARGQVPETPKKGTYPLKRFPISLSPIIPLPLGPPQKKQRPWDTTP